MAEDRQIDVDYGKRHLEGNTAMHLLAPINYFSFSTETISSFQHCHEVSCPHQLVTEMVNILYFAEKFGATNYDTVTRQYEDKFTPKGEFLLFPFEIHVAFQLQQRCLSCGLTARLQFQGCRVHSTTRGHSQHLSTAIFSIKFHK